MSYLLPILLANFAAVGLGQFLFLAQAERIRQRFAELGLSMQTKPENTLFGNSRFWREAGGLNAVRKDPTIASILNRHNYFVAYAWVSFVALAIVVLSA